jgi:hypothetical protein
MTGPICREEGTVCVDLASLGLCDCHTHGDACIWRPRAPHDVASHRAGNHPGDFRGRTAGTRNSTARKEAHQAAHQADASGDDGTADLLVSQVIRTNEMQVWFLAEHLVDAPLVRAE